MDGITLVLSLLPALFETVVDMSEALKVDAERRKSWTDLATHIAPYPTGVLPNTTTEIFIDYDQCDRLQDGAQNCLWSVHMPLFPLGTVGLNSSARDRTLATSSVAAWCPPLLPAPTPVPAKSRLPHTRVTARRSRGEYLNWRTLDSARQFAAAARIGYNSTATLAAMESVLSAITGAEKDDREEEVRRPGTLASMDFDDDMLTGSAGEGGFEPVMQTCDEDDQAAMESVLFRFNGQNEIESVEEKRKPSTLASIDFDDDMFVGAGDGVPEPVMQTCDEDDQAAMENVLSTFGTKRRDAAADNDDDDEGKSGRRDVLAGCVALLSALALAPTATAADIVDTGGYMSFEELEARARAAYRAKRLDEARDLLTRIIGMEPEDGTWRERRAQVLVDLKQFQAAIEDFDAAESLYDKDYKSLGLFSNRALAREGLSDWSGAVRDYTECINLSREIGGVPPYVLNSRGNAFSSLGRYDEALGDYEEAAKTFQVMKNLSGAIYARSNAALTLAELGRDEEAMREMEAVARRAAGSIDMRAALAAMHWSRGEEDEAERDWNWACEKINSGVLTEGGPALDGCALYRDSDWLGRIRRWPPSMVSKMDDFIRLRKPSNA